MNLPPPVHLAISLMLATLAASACEPDETESDEALGVGQQEFANLKGEVDISDSFASTQRNALSPSAAWIRTPNNAGGPTKGHVLVSYARREATATGAPYDGAAWAYSTFPFDVATPTYGEVRANEWVAATNSFRWPAPANLCQYYGNAAECGGAGAAWSTSTAIHWLVPAAALWTGLDRTATVITTGSGALGQTDSTGVFAVSSNDGGQTFRRSLIISTEEGGPATLGTEGVIKLSGGNSCRAACMPPSRTSASGPHPSQEAKPFRSTSCGSTTPRPATRRVARRSGGGRASSSAKMAT